MTSPKVIYGIVDLSFSESVLFVARSPPRPLTAAHTQYLFFFFFSPFIRLHFLTSCFH